MQISREGALLRVTTRLTADVIAKLKATPSKYQFKGSAFLFDPTPAALEHITVSFADTKWDNDAWHLMRRVQGAAAAPAALHAGEESYVWKSKPYAHQTEFFHKTRDVEYYGFWWEMGTGKSKLMLDTAAWNWQRKAIRGLLVIAFPNGVHDNWIEKEVPAHLPDWCPRTCVAWDGSKSDKQLSKLWAAGKETGNLIVLTMNVEALSSKRGMDAAMKFVQTFKSMVVIDESTSIKKPKAKRTKNIIKLKQYAVIRRVLSGSPVTKGPLDLYTQLAFLDDDILQCGSFWAFRAQFAVMKELPGKTSRFGPVKIVVGYKNLEELTRLMAPHTSRLLKSEVIDLPPKIYMPPLRVEMSARQWELYEELRENTIVEFQGATISAPLAMTRLMRLHQIVCGFLPLENADSLDAQPVDERDLRLEAAMEFIETLQGKALIWANYRYNIRQLVMALREAYGEASAAGYSGQTPASARAGLVSRFQNPDDPLRWLVCNKAAAYGLTMTQARTCFYYANSYELEVRLQSEDRPHRIGLQHAVSYADMVAKGTVDEKLINALIDKKDIANEINGDRFVEWLKPC